MTEKTYDLLFFVDAYPAIGMGHLKRCIDILKRVLQDYGKISYAFVGRLSDSAFSFLKTHFPEDIHLYQNESNIQSRVAVYDTMDDPEDPGFIAPQRLARIRERTHRLVLISSAIKLDISVPIDILIDHMPSVSIRGISPRKIYSGLQFAPVDSHFFQTDGTSPFDTKTFLAIIGGHAHQYGPFKFAEHIVPVLKEFYHDIRCIVSPMFPDGHLSKLRNLKPSVEFLKQVPAILPYIKTARVVLTTYGNATYESLALSRPTYVLSYKSFQNEYARVLEEKGWVVNLGLFKNIDEEKLPYLVSDEVQRRLFDNIKDVSIGAGIQNMARIITEVLHDVSNTG